MSLLQHKCQVKNWETYTLIHTFGQTNMHVDGACKIVTLNYHPLLYGIYAFTYVVRQCNVVLKSAVVLETGDKVIHFEGWKFLPWVAVQRVI